MFALGKNSTISNKVSNGSAVGILSTLISAAVVYFVPSWQSGIPTFWQMVIAGGAGAIGYFGGGWLSTHKATVSEVQTAIGEAETLLSLIPKAQATVTAPPAS